MEETSIKPITAGDIKRRHPRYLTCPTDKAYASLANDISKVLEHDLLAFMEPKEARNSCISLALHFEDLHSGFHLFETFTRMYQKMFGCYLPFYPTKGADDPEAEVDGMRFMIWLCLQAEREERMLNPSNDGFRQMALKLLRLWHDKESTIPPNEELADYLYAEETQTDADEVKTVLVWLARYCPQGRWFTNPSDMEKLNDLKQFLHGADKDTMAYAADCYTLFDIPTWPLSVMPQHVYAEMIRIDMDDPEDELAEAIDQMQDKPFSIFEVVGSSERKLQLKDTEGNIFSVSPNDFFGDIRKLTRQNTHLAGSFICLDGVWRLNGPSLWMKPTKKEYENYVRKVKMLHRPENDNEKHSTTDYVNRHDGERLYFFRNLSQYESWFRTDFGIQKPDLSAFEEYKDYPLAVFLGDDGLIKLCLMPEVIKHPYNDYYNKQAAEEKDIWFVCDQSVCAPDMLLYLMEHRFLPEAMFNDMRGREHGRRLMQENLEFVARCMRRDIRSTTVFHKRDLTTTTVDTDDILDKYRTKHPYEKFVDMIGQEDVIVSRARKEWQVVRADSMVTVIRDVKRRQDFEMPTRDLYEAHLSLSSKEIQVSALVPFVGKDNAPAASALLYNIVGQGQDFNNFRKYVHDAMAHGGFEELRKRLSGK